MKKVPPELKVHCEGSLELISNLTPHPKNANSHPEEQVERLARILAYQGFRAPVVVSNQTGLIIAGHGRIEAAKANGWDMVPVVRQDFESADQELAHLHADNAIASWSDLDLSFINDQMGDFGPDFDIDMLGIKSFEIEPADKLEPQLDVVERKPITCPECEHEFFPGAK